MSEAFQSLAFFRECDLLKTERRANWTHAVPRQESVAEHVWHATLLAVLLDDVTPDGVDANHVRDLLVVHDLVEVYAHDTVIWDDVPIDDVSAREWAAGERLCALLPAGIRGRIDPLWQEFQLQQTDAARYARALDALHPMVISWFPGAVGHANKTLTPAKILARKEPLIGAYPALWSLATWLVRRAVEQQLIPDDTPSLLGQLPDASPLADRLAFFVATDSLKHERRANLLLTDARQETVAEHCWHVTLLSLLLRDVQLADVDADHVRDLLTIHDLVEVYAGDTPVSDVARRATAHVREAESADCLLALLPSGDVRYRFRRLIDEYQESTTAASQVALALDALHPLLQTWLPGAYPHPLHAVTPMTAERLYDRKRASIERVPSVWSIMDEVVRAAVDRGDLATR